MGEIEGQKDYSSNRHLPLLGFGSLRLPTIKNDNSLIDYETLCEMIDVYISSSLKGKAYFEAAYGYHGGTVEEALRKNLVNRYSRDEFLLTDKLPLAMIRNPREMQEIFSHQLRRCGVEYFDYYLLHNIGKSSFEKAKSIGVFEYILDLKNKGLVRNIGFSFHDKASVLEEILSQYGDMLDVVQLQINYLDWKSPVIQAEQCYKVARSFDLPIIVMEPLKGGLLSCPLESRPAVEYNFENFTPVQCAFNFISSLDGVKFVLSGMSNLEQVTSNTDVFKRLRKPNELETKYINLVRDYIQQTKPIQCTNCGYCLEKCPKKIPIPDLFELYNSDNQGHVGGIYARICEGKGRASDCIDCKACTVVCSQLLDIPTLLIEVANEFERVDLKTRIKETLKANSLFEPLLSCYRKIKRFHR